MLRGLTGLRFLLAAVVVVFHYTAGKPMPGPQPLVEFFSNGHAVVSCFFVLSGFVLTKTYLTPEGRLPVSNWEFWRARFARIYPVYLLSLVLSYPVYLALAKHTASQVVTTTLAALTLTQAWSPQAAHALNSAGWSLSVEAFLYLLFPLIAPAISRRPIVVLALATLVHWPLSNLDSQNPLCHLPAFAAGIAAYSLRSSWRLLPLASALTITVILGGFFELRGALLLPFVGLVVGLAAHSSGIGSDSFLRLGEWSYALYLLHLPVWTLAIVLNEVTFALPMHSWLFVACSFGFALFCSYLAYTHIEEPCRKTLRGLPKPIVSLPVSA